MVVQMAMGPGIERRSRCRQVIRLPPGPDQLRHVLHGGRPGQLDQLVFGIPGGDARDGPDLGVAQFPLAERRGDLGQITQRLHAPDQFDQAVLGAMDRTAERDDGFGERLEGVGGRLIHGCTLVNWPCVQYSDQPDNVNANVLMKGL